MGCVTICHYVYIVGTRLPRHRAFSPNPHPARPLVCYHDADIDTDVLAIRTALIISNYNSFRTRGLLNVFEQ